MTIERPWLNEPDRLEFEAHGFPCIIQRVAKEFSGHLCGYVAVNEKHPSYGKDYSEVDVNVHGGLTYAGECQSHICHKPKEGESDKVWWLGFDAGHCYDLTPWAYEQRQPGGLFSFLREGNNILMEMEEYRDINYMKAECEQLAKQLREIA